MPATSQRNYAINLLLQSTRRGGRAQAIRGQGRVSD